MDVDVHPVDHNLIFPLYMYRDFRLTESVPRGQLF